MYLRRRSLRSLNCEQLDDWAAHGGGRYPDGTAPEWPFAAHEELFEYHCIICALRRRDRLFPCSNILHTSPVHFLNLCSIPSHRIPSHSTPQCKGLCCTGIRFEHEARRIRIGFYVNMCNVGIAACGRMYHTVREYLYPSAPSGEVKSPTADRSWHSSVSGFRFLLSLSPCINMRLFHLLVVSQSVYPCCCSVVYARRNDRSVKLLEMTPLHHGRKLLRCTKGSGG